MPECKEEETKICEPDVAADSSDEDALRATRVKSKSTKKKKSSSSQKKLIHSDPVSDLSMKIVNFLSSLFQINIFSGSRKRNCGRKIQQKERKEQTT